MDLLKETVMLGCKPIVLPIDQRFNLSAKAEELNYREKYQRLVGCLIYLSHMRPDIAFAVSAV
jgi:hypothetical protein